MRFGPTSGPTWAVLTTSTSNGSVGAMHDSLNPMTGLMPMVGMWLNATFGGVGVGMINMFLYVVIAVFVAGMMVGRTPEYLERRVEAPRSSSPSWPCWRTPSSSSPAPRSSPRRRGARTR